MEPVYTLRHNVFEGYVIKDKDGKELISVHNNINGPESWYFTCRKLAIFSHRLIKKDSSQVEILEALSYYITAERKKFNEVINSLEEEISNTKP